jgi:hypothetical protein
MLEDSRYKLNPIVSIIRELEFYKKWFPLAITAILILMALLICYVFYVVGGILFISKLTFFRPKMSKMQKASDVSKSNSNN